MKRTAVGGQRGFNPENILGTYASNAVSSKWNIPYMYRYTAYFNTGFPVYVFLVLVVYRCSFKNDIAKGFSKHWPMKPFVPIDFGAFWNQLHAFNTRVKDS